VTQSTGGSIAGVSASAAPTRAASIETLSPPCGRANWKSAAQASSSVRGTASQGTPSHDPKSISMMRASMPMSNLRAVAIRSARRKQRASGLVTTRDTSGRLSRITSAAPSKPSESGTSVRP
jgi:hypothetical protein